MIGRVEKMSAGAGCGTVPGADQDTVTAVAGSAPQVSSSCSGAVVVGSGSVVVGGPEGAVAAVAAVAASAAWWVTAASVTVASPATALTPTTPARKLRRENPDSSPAPGWSAALMSDSSMSARYKRQVNPP